jgi:hypothetical protein
LLVDDGSDLETLETIRKFEESDARIKVLRRNRSPKGPNTCRNIGLEAAQAKYVMFLDSDDLLSDACLKCRLEEAEVNPDADFLVFQGEIFTNAPGDGGGRVWNTPTPEPDVTRFVRGDSVWQTSGPMWTKSALNRLGGFDEDLSCWQDVDIHARALLSDLKYVKKLDAPPDYFYRKHRRATISQNGIRNRDDVASVLSVCEKMLLRFPIPTPPEFLRASREALAFGVLLALDNRHFELARRGISIAQQNRLLSSSENLVWRLATVLYASHSHGVRGCARFGRRLMKSFLPRRPHTSPRRE